MEYHDFQLDFESISASPCNGMPEADFDGNCDSYLSTSSSRSTLSNEDWVTVIHELSIIRDESENTRNERERGRTSFACPIAILNSGYESCPCTSISETFNINGPIQEYWISQALYSARDNNVLSGTGDWLLNSCKYRTWLGDSHSSVLWLQGSAGTGKSMLTSAVVNNLKANSRPLDIITFYFIDGRFPHHHTARSILWAILSGLKSRRPGKDSLTCLDALSVEVQNIDNHLSISQLRALLSMMVHSLKIHEKLIFIIDALDECEPAESGLSELLRQLQDFTRPPDDRHLIKFFISCRPAVFYRYQNPAVDSLQVDLDNEPLFRQDLMAYIRHGLTGLDILLPPTDLTMLRDRLNCQTKATFLWVHLVLRELSIGASSPKSLHDLIDTIPSNVYGIYDLMVARISKSDRSLAHIVLTWIMHAARPLTLAEFNSTVRLEMVLTESDIWKISGGFVVLAEDKTMGLVHHSAKEYLIASENRLDESTTYKNPHELIACMCLQSLSGVDLLRSLGIIPASFVPKATNSHHSGTWSYAGSFWKWHYGLGESHSSRLPGLLLSHLREALESNFEAFKDCLLDSPTLGFNFADLQANGLHTDIATVVNSYVTEVALLIAAGFGFDRIAKLVLQMGAHTNLPHGVRKWMPLHAAVQNRHHRLVERLILYGANVNASTAEGYTPLYYATTSGHYDIMRMLIEHGAGIEDPETYDRMTLSSPRAPEVVFWDYVIGSTVIESCGECEEMSPKYTISPISGQCAGENLLPVITFLGESTSTAAFTEAVREQRTSKLRRRTKHMCAVADKVKIKWFSGRNMHKALSIAAKRGLEDVKRLLILAGNDPCFLDGLSLRLSNMSLGT